MELYKSDAFLDELLLEDCPYMDLTVELLGIGDRPGELVCSPLHREGYRGGTWVLLDYGCIAVHVFNAEAREFYGLERLWRDGKPLDLTGVTDDRE